MISPKIEQFIQKFQQFFPSRSDENAPKIHVDEVASQVAAFYEKIRTIVSYQGEHVIRQNATERILKRRLFFKKSGKEVSEPLVSELIRGGHFKNDAIPEYKTGDIAKIIDKYNYILNNAPESEKEKNKKDFSEWLFSLASCEIEEKLDPPIKDILLADYLYETIKDKIKTDAPEDEKNVQLFIAIQKTLLKADQNLVKYRLLKWHYSPWSKISEEFLPDITQNIFKIRSKLEKELAHPLAPKFLNICNRYTAIYLVIGDIVEENPLAIREKIEQKEDESLELLIRKHYEKRFAKNKSLLRRMAIYSTVSVFLSKILIALLIEVPFDKYVTHQYSNLNTALNIIIPPLLMLMIILSIKTPSQANTQKMIWEIIKTIQEKSEKIHEIKLLKKRGIIWEIVVNLVYLSAFAASFGLMALGLKKINFSDFSIAIFLIFISLILFLGALLRQKSKEFFIEEEKETFFTMTADFFSVPFIHAGKILSKGLARLNVIIFFLNFILEIPFQTFVEFLENWRLFLKKKKEEIE